MGATSHLLLPFLCIFSKNKQQQQKKKKNPERKIWQMKMLLLILQTNQNGRRVVGEGVSNYSFYALEAKAKPARVKYNLVSNQLAD